MIKSLSINNLSYHYNQKKIFDDINFNLFSGEFTVLLDWMRSHIHVHGSKLPPADLLREATGKDPSSDDFVKYLKTKYTKIYNL